jgi:hypothetical protein
MLQIPRSRSSFTRRSCRVLFIRSTRPFACGEFAQMMSISRSVRARPDLRFGVGAPGRTSVTQAEDAVSVADRHPSVGRFLRGVLADFRSSGAES